MTKHDNLGSSHVDTNTAMSQLNHDDVSSAHIDPEGNYHSASNPVIAVDSSAFVKVPMTNKDTSSTTAAMQNMVISEKLGESQEMVSCCVRCFSVITFFLNLPISYTQQ